MPDIVLAFEDKNMKRHVTCIQGYCKSSGETDNISQI